MRDGTEPLRELEEHPVRREDPHPGVQPCEPVDVEHEQRERVVREPRAEDLASDDLRKRLPVEQVREHVELRHDVGVAQVERPRNRGARSLDERLEPVDVLLAEAPVAVARQDAQQALRLVAGEERHDEPRAHRLLSLGCHEIARERDLDRTRAAVVGEPQPGDVVRLGLRQPDRRDDRGALAAGDERDRPIGRRPLARQLERPHHRLGIVLELERCDRQRGLESRQRVVERLGETRKAVVVAPEHRRRHIGLTREQSPEGEDEERDGECREDDCRESDPRGHAAPSRVEPGARPSIELTLQRGVAG